MDMQGEDRLNYRRLTVSGKAARKVVRHRTRLTNDVLFEEQHYG